jgi:hypothetical protein
MSKQTQLTLASLGMMMLPYRAEFLLSVVVCAAMGTAAYSTTKKHLAQLESSSMLGLRVIGRSTPHVAR